MSVKKEKLLTEALSYFSEKDFDSLSITEKSVFCVGKVLLDEMVNNVAIFVENENNDMSLYIFKKSEYISDNVEYDKAIIVINFNNSDIQIKSLIEDDRQKMFYPMSRLPIKLKVNRIICPCDKKEFLESKHRHDFKFCSCREVAVDGGLDYLRRIGNVSVINEANIYELDFNIL